MVLAAGIAHAMGAAAAGTMEVITGTGMATAPESRK